MECDARQQGHQESSRSDSSKRLPLKGKQSIEKPLVPCQIRRIERIGVTQRSNTPYIVYYTQYGKCCTFVSRQYFWQSLFNLCGIKQQSFDRIAGYGISRFSITVLEGENRYSLPVAEVGVFLARQNQRVLDGLQVNLIGNRILVWNPVSQQMHEVSNDGCTCADKLCNQCFCKHRIAAHLHVRSLGWGSLQQFLNKNSSGMQTETLEAIAAF